MLVLIPRHVVTTIHVSPVNVEREVFVGESFPSVGGGLLCSTFEFSLFYTARSALDFVEETFGRLGGLGNTVALVEGLGEGVDSVIVLGVVLLGIGGLVHNHIGPSVLGSSPGALALDSNIVDTTADAEQTTLAPVRAP